MTERAPVRGWCDAHARFELVLKCAGCHKKFCEATFEAHQIRVRGESADSLKSICNREKARLVAAIEGAP